MSEAKFTPGPWRVEGAGYGAVVFQTRGLLAQVTGDDVTRYANAHLISAAPDLLAALKELLKARWMCTVDWAPQEDYEAVCDRARAAIAKAESNEVRRVREGKE